MDRARFLKWHRWLALGAGVALLVQLTSGAVLSGVKLAEPTARAARAPLSLGQMEVLSERVRVAHPGAFVERVEILRHATAQDSPIAELRWRLPGERLPRFSRFELTTGRLLLESTVTQSLEHAALYLHSNWFLGNGGRYALAVLGLALFAIACTAMVVWWPTAERIKRVWAALPKARGATRLAVYHRLLGVPAVPAAAWLAVSGALLAVQPMQFPLLKPVPCESASSATTAGDVRIDHAASGMRLRFVSFCRLPSSVIGLTYVEYLGSAPISLRQVFVDRASGHELASNAIDDGFWRVAGRYLVALHTGRWFGVPGEVFALLAGVTVLLTGCVGVLTWWARRSSRSRMLRCALPSSGPSSA